MNKLFTYGIRYLFGGARRGQAGVAGLGAALAIVGWARSRNHSKELLYKRKLKAGEEVRVRFLRGESGDDMTVTG